MPRSKIKKATKSQSTNGSAALIPRLTGDAQKLIAANRDEVAKAVHGFRKDIEKRAERAVREVERKILKQMHVATEEQLQSLESRVARLERHA